MKPLKITCVDAMVRIESDDIYFTYFGDKEKKHIDIGLQTNSHLNKKAVKKMCVEISEAIMRFKKII